jgi:hypothetical protein
MQKSGVAQETATVERNSPVKTEVGDDQSPFRHCELSPFNPRTVHVCGDGQDTSGTNADWNPGTGIGRDHVVPSNVE